MSPLGYRAMRGKWLLIVRRIHLYLGVFFAPLLLLFVITGWWQMFAEDRMLQDERKAPVINQLSRIHVGQYYPGFGKTTLSSTAFEILVVAMCIGLILLILLGVILAFTATRHRTPVFFALI